MTIIRAARATSPRSRTECCTPIRLLDLNALTFPIGARVAVFFRKTTLRGSRFRPARLAAGKPGVVRDAPLASSGKHQGSCHRSPRRIRTHPRSSYRRSPSAQRYRQALPSAHHDRCAILGAVLVQERQGRCSWSHCEADSIVTSLGIRSNPKAGEYSLILASAYPRRATGSGSLATGITGREAEHCRRRRAHPALPAVIDVRLLAAGERLPAEENGQILPSVYPRVRPDRGRRRPR
jgi:hypothetical protein